MSIGLNWTHLSEQEAAAKATTPTATVLPTDAYNLFNLNGSWQFTERFRLRAGIDNLFDKDPPLALDPYVQTLTNEYDFAGRFFYLKATVKL